MKLTRCAQGHFYDMDKFATCPHCSGGDIVDDGATSAFTESIYVMPATNNNPAPQYGMHHENEKPTEALPGMSKPMPPIMAMADGDRTIGIYDSAFVEVKSQESSPVNAVQTVLPKSGKATTPCVGWLVAISGKYVGTDFRLKVGKNFIGRSATMDIALLEDKSVSRKCQAIVVYEPKSHIYLAQAGESSSLFYRNGEVVLTPVKLDAYDILSVGDTELLFIPLCNETFNWDNVLAELKNKQ